MPGMPPMMNGAPPPGFQPPPGEQLVHPLFRINSEPHHQLHVRNACVRCRAAGHRAGMAPPPGWRPGMMAAPPGMNGMPGPHPGMMPMSVGGPPQQQHYGMR